MITEEQEREIEQRQPVDIPISSADVHRLRKRFPGGQVELGPTANPNEVAILVQAGPVSISGRSRTTVDSDVIHWSLLIWPTKPVVAA